MSFIPLRYSFITNLRQANQQTNKTFSFSSLYSVLLVFNVEDQNIFNLANHVKKQLASNESNDQQQQQQEMSNQLPVPLMQTLNNGNIISSIVVAPVNNSPVGSNNQQQQQQIDGPNQSHIGRQQQFGSELPLIALSNSDILVRLVGYFHARCALHYFLCYLLSSSVSILICLRLFRMCNWQTRPSESSAKHSNIQITDPTNYGFYYRTRLGK